MTTTRYQATVKHLLGQGIPEFRALIQGIGISILKDESFHDDHLETKRLKTHDARMEQEKKNKLKRMNKESATATSKKMQTEKRS